MRRGGHRGNCKPLLETFTPPTALQSDPAPRVQFPQHGDLKHFLALVRYQGVEAAANAYTKEEILKLMRINGFTYINARARKIDLAHALAGA